MQRIKEELRRASKKEYFLISEEKLKEEKKHYIETRLELEGLKEEGKRLFTTLLHGTFDALLKKTGGHPLSIEIIAKNVTTIDDTYGAASRC